MSRKRLLTLVLPLISLSLSYTVVMHTPMPLHLVAEKLAPVLLVEGVSGSLATGFQARKISTVGREDLVIEIEDVNISYPYLIGMLIKKEIILSDISAQKVYLSMAGLPSFSNPESKPAAPTAPKKNVEEKESWYSIQRFELQNFQVKNYFLKTPLMVQPQTLENFQYQGLIWEKDQPIQLGVIQIQSPDMEIFAQHVPPEAERKDYFDFYFSFALKNGNMLPTGWSLKKPLDFQGRVQFDKNRPRWHITGLDRRIQFRVDPVTDQIHFKIHPLNLKDYFSSAPPIYHLSLDFRSNWAPNMTHAMMLLSQTGQLQKGSFLIGTNTFVIHSQPVLKLFLDRGVRGVYSGQHGHITARFGIGIGPFSYGAGQDIQLHASRGSHGISISQKPTQTTGSVSGPGIYLTSDRHMDKQEILARLYYNKAFEQLSRRQRDYLVMTSGFFKMDAVPRHPAAHGP